MKANIKYLMVTVLCSLFFSVFSFAQIENVIIENYYISDALDSTDTIGGKLEQGSKTYRVFIDLKKGSKIKKIFGSSTHPLKISSTETFFNNQEDGQSFGKDFSKSRYESNTVALDTWLTLGQTTRLSLSTNFGILKNQDRNGSFIGGANNDGGSAGILIGLLTNSDPLAGIPLTSSDGMDTMFNTPKDWLQYGIQDISGIDTTIFGSTRPGKEFISYNAGLQNSGVEGVISDSNQVLIAQLTTKGNLSFEINLEVEELIDGLNKRIVKYVAKDTLLAQDEVFSPFLNYPYICGCQDPNYLESKTKYACEDKSACKTLIVFGCMDTMACNYNEFANFNIQTLCCYIGYCNDLRINEVCPNLKVRDKNKILDFEIYPNPVRDQLVLNFFSSIAQNIQYSIYDGFGKLVMKDEVTSWKERIDVSKLINGIYLIRITSNDLTLDKLFLKN